MSDEKRKDLEQRGLIVLNIWHTIIAIGAIIIGIGLFVGANNTRLSNVEAKSAKTEQRQDQLENTIPKQLIELKINLKSFMELNNYHYQEQQ